MRKKLLYLLFFLFGGTTIAQLCPDLTLPLDGATNVSINTDISWNEVDSALGYFLTVGTAIGLRDIVDRIDVGGSTSFTPPAGLPANTTIYVKITLYFSSGPVMACPVQEFTTGAQGAIPDCTRLVSPMNGDTDVPVLSPLNWEDVPNADGYKVSIGTSPLFNDVLEAVFDSSASPPINLVPNSNFYVTIVPFNNAGDALGCAQESFSTSSGCGPFIDPDTGAMVDLRPELDFPDQISICLDDIPLTVTTTDNADGFRWYQVNADGTEILLSDTPEVHLSEEGQYRYEAYNTIKQLGNTIECSNFREFTVVASEIATIIAVNLSQQQTGTRIEVEVEGLGDYEFALDDPNGPYQDSPVFEDVPNGFSSVFVRDKNSCGIAQEIAGIPGYPKFFTPNGDDINDFWQIEGTDPNMTISIYDRFGKLLKQFDSSGQGWDGTYKDTPLPASDYWFRVIVPGSREFKGHFALKR